MKRKLNFSASYVVLQIFSFILFGWVWSNVAVGRIYVCNDPIPVLDLFLIPLVHGGNTGDYHVFSPVVTYTSWLVTILASIGFSVFLNKLFQVKPVK